MFNVILQQTVLKNVIKNTLKQRGYNSNELLRNKTQYNSQARSLDQSLLS